MGKGSVIMGTIATLLAVPTIAAGVIAAIPEKREKALDWVAKYSNEYKLKDKEIKDLRAENEAKTAELNTARTNLTRVQSELTTANANLAQARADKESLQTQLNSANAEKARLTTELATANGDKAELQTQLNSVNAQITSLNSQLAENAQLIAGLEEEVDELSESVNTLTARVSELEVQLEEAQSQSNDVEISNRRFNYNLAFNVGNNTSFSLYKYQYNDTSILSSANTKALLSENANLIGFGLEEYFDLNIPSLDINTQVSKRYMPLTNYATSHITFDYENFEEYGINSIDDIDPSSKTTYSVALNEITYTKYTIEELNEMFPNVNFSGFVSSERFYIKDIFIDLTIAVEEYSDEFILEPQLGTYLAEDGTMFQFYRDQNGRTYYKKYSSGRWGYEQILNDFNVDNDNNMFISDISTQIVWQTSDSFVVEYSSRYPELQGLLFEKQPAIDVLKNALANGGLITLTEDITLENETLEVTAKNVSINLGGHTITGANIDGAVFKVNAGSQFGLVGTGTIRGGSGADCRCIEVQGNLYVHGNVTMSVGPDANGQGNSCIFVNADGAQVYIEDGTYSTDADWNGFYYVVNVKNNVKNYYILICGGTFKNYDPSLGDDVLGGNYISDGYFIEAETDGTDTYFTVVRRELETVFFGEENKIKIYNNNDFEFVQLDNEYDILAQGTISVDENTGIVTLTFSDGTTQEIQLNEEFNSFELDGETFVMFDPSIHYEYYGHYYGETGSCDLNYNYTFKLTEHFDHYNEELDQYEPEDIERTGTFETHFDEMTGESSITLHFEDGTEMTGWWDPYNGSFSLVIDENEYWFYRS